MKQAEPDGTIDPNTLLDLWLGDATPPPPRRKRSTRLTLLLAILALVVAALLAKYAIDLLAIAIALLVVGVVLHVLGIRLAESGAMSPAWFLIVVLGIVLVAYTLFVPSDSIAGLSRLMPKWMAATLEWSETHGWAGRVLSDPDDTIQRPSSPAEPPPASPATSSSSPAISVGGRGPSVVVTASASTSVVGEGVTFMARVSDGSRGQESVRYFDGLTWLGTAQVTDEGRTRIAYLRVPGLTVGQHQIRAEVTAPSGRVTVSAPVRHTVLEPR